MATEVTPLTEERSHAEVDRQLRAIVGPDAVLNDPVARVAYECDGATFYRAQPDWIVFPTTTEQVVAVVRLANRCGIPFVARGAGTGLSGGCMSARGGILIALNRMNRILELDVDNRRAVVQPGVINLHITQAAAPFGYHYAPDPSSQKACTIGGNVAENSGGPHTLKYGVTLNHILGVECVLPTGEVVTLGNRGEDPVGYDLLGLFIGSEGTFGIATAITVRLTRNPEGYRTLLAVFRTIEDASTAVSEIIAHGIIPAALEMMDRLVIQAVEEAFHFGFPEDAEAVLIVELDGVIAGMDRQAEAIAALCKQNGAVDVRTARDDAERELLWKSRKQAFGALGRIAPSFLTQDGVVPRTRLPEVLRFVGQVSRKYNLPIANVFHAGDGNIHPIFLFHQDNEEECRRVLEASDEILRKCVQVGGTITGEHGIGVEKIEFMRLLFTPRELELMRSLRAIFDPAGLANPGKIFPDEGTNDEGTALDG